MKYIQWQVSESNVANLWLNRSDRGNALNSHFICELSQAITEITQSHAIRLILIRAHGNHFCSGADLNDMRLSGQKDYQDNLADAQQLFDLFQQLDQINIPIIAVAHGSVFGGGIGLICCADIAIGITGGPTPLRFCFSETRLGLVPAVISPYVIKTMGQRQASRYLLSAEVLDEINAYHSGLIHLLCNHSEIELRLNTLCQSIIANGPEAVRTCKQLLRDSKYPPDREQLCQLIAERRKSPEGQEGISAFLEKRKPNWY